MPQSFKNTVLILRVDIERGRFIFHAVAALDIGFNAAGAKAAGGTRVTKSTGPKLMLTITTLAFC